MAEGFVLMIVGMITVFAFLALLVTVMLLSTVFFRKFAHLFPEELTEPVASAAANPAAVIAVALAAIRAKRG